MATLILNTVDPSVNSSGLTGCCRHGAMWLQVYGGKIGGGEQVECGTMKDADHLLGWTEMLVILAKESRIICLFFSLLIILGECLRL